MYFNNFHIGDPLKNAQCLVQELHKHIIATGFSSILNTLFTFWQCIYRQVDNAFLLFFSAVGFRWPSGSRDETWKSEIQAWLASKEKVHIFIQYTISEFLSDPEFVSPNAFMQKGSPEEFGYSTH